MMLSARRIACYDKMLSSHLREVFGVLSHGEASPLPHLSAPPGNVLCCPTTAKSTPVEDFKVTQ